ncbi:MULTISPECIES: hypothetical protein [unclassified Bradyrhizobium]|jgi:hypothetical protein|uniref:hypothetical protein n=1 Tax=unclassified Bradyrhizobium TaxID=2631580 RepID=UPI000AA99433|nr:MULTISPECIES: hypothetical protein [unclassified Bradyrhizobium]
MLVMRAVGKVLWGGAAIAVPLAMYGAAMASTQAGIAQFIPLGAVGIGLLLMGALLHAR